MATTDNFQAHWPEPTLNNIADDTYGHFPAIDYERSDGERVIVRVYEDGAGRLIVSIAGTKGADVIVEEDDESTAAVTVAAFQCPDEQDVDPETSDWARINAAAQQHHWRRNKEGDTWIYERGGRRIEVTYSAAGRLVYAATTAEVGDWTHFVGRDRAERLLAVITAEPKEQAAS